MLGNYLLSHLKGSTISTGRLDFRVRDGNGYFPAVKSPSNFKVFCFTHIRTKTSSLYRFISTPRLRSLQTLYLEPMINASIDSPGYLPGTSSDT
jgi:hypothetical protein